MSDPNAASSAASNTVGPTDLFRQLAAVFADQLNRFQSEQQTGDAEKRARALSVLAKTLESIIAVGLKLNAVGASNLDPSTPAGAGDLVVGSQANGTAELDRQLLQLVGNLVQAGEAE